MKRIISYQEDGSAVLVEIYDDSNVTVDIVGSVDSEEVADDKDWKGYHKNLKTGAPIIGKVRKNRLKQG